MGFTSPLSADTWPLLGAAALGAWLLLRGAAPGLMGTALSSLGFVGVYLLLRRPPTGALLALSAWALALQLFAALCASWLPHRTGTLRALIETAGWWQLLRSGTLAALWQTERAQPYFLGAVSHSLALWLPPATLIAGATLAQLTLSRRSRSHLGQVLSLSVIAGLLVHLIPLWLEAPSVEALSNWLRQP